MTTREDQPQRYSSYHIIYLILVVFTAIEVGISYFTSLTPAIKIPLLVVLSATKVWLVALYFMRLHFDKRLFAMPFILGLIIAIPVILFTTLALPGGAVYKPTNNNSPAQSASTEQAAQGNTNQGGNNQGGKAQTINVAEKNYAIALDSTNIQAGEITFRVTNQASDMPHNAVVFKTDLAPDKLPLDASGSVDENKLKPLGKTSNIAPGKSEDLKLTLDGGKYVMICDVPGHYQQGMRIGFTVSGQLPAGAQPSGGGSAAATAAPTSQATNQAAPAATTAAPTNQPAANAPTNQPTQAANAATNAATSAATANANNNANSGGQPSDVNVSEVNYKIQMPTDLQAGDVTFHVKNDAKDMPHDFIVIQTDKPADKLPLDSTGKVDQGQVKVLGKSKVLNPGENQDVKINLPAGKYVAYCDVPGHYQQGMVITFNVGGGNAGGNAATAAPTSQATQGATSGATTAATTAPTTTQVAQGPTLPASSPTPTGPSKDINVIEQNFSIDLSPAIAIAGQVTFHISNQSASLPHDFMIIQTDLQADQLPLDNSGNVDMSKLKVLGQVNDIAPGDTKTLQVNLLAGQHYVVICNKPGNYQHGMYASLGTITVPVTPTPVSTASASGTLQATQGATMAATKSNAPSGEIDVVEQNFSIDLSPTVAIAGPVLFHVHNQSASLSHDFMVIQTDLQADKLPLDNSGNVDMSKLNMIGQVQDIAPGDTKTLQVTLQPGQHYVVICNKPGNYQHGMYASLGVQGAPTGATLSATANATSDATLPATVNAATQR